MTPLAPHITAFFEQHLLFERRASEQTRDSYAHAFKLFLTYASKRLKVTPSRLTIEQIDAPLVVDFLQHLETTRGNSPNSRNNRLAAIKSFLHFLEYREPSAVERIRRILAIPFKKTESRLVPHLSVGELQAILDGPTPTTWAGTRDRALLHLCYAGGLRVSELIGLRVDDLTFHPDASMLIRGKGRRERSLPLWKTTTMAVRAWLAVRGNAPVPELFINARCAVYALRHRICSAQARRNCETTVSLARHKACVPASLAAHLCINGAGIDERPSKGFAVARSRTHANDGGLHTG
jgi:integrase/recombinase XerD